MTDRIAGRYTLRRSLGRGSLGEVHEADDDELHQRIAIRLLHADVLADPGTVARLRRQVANAQRVTHPGVCRVFDIEAAVGFCTMELLEGETLAARLGRGALTIADAVPIVEQVCAGLAAAHEAGVVHGDLSPRNVMLCADRAVITDLGMAIEGDVATDLRALGVMMSDMVGRGADPRWDAMIRRCLARDPAARPSPAAIVAALRGRRPRRWIAAAVGAGALVGAVAVVLAARSAPPGAGPRVVTVASPGKEMIEDSTRDPDGNLYVCGHFSAGSKIAGVALVHPGGGAKAGFIAGIGSDGHVRWHRSFATGSTAVVVMCVADDRGRVFVGGRTDDDGFLGAMSAADGATLWETPVIGSIMAGDLGPDGNLHVTGDTAGSPFVASFDRDGALRWRVDGSGAIRGHTRVLAFRDDVVVVGGDAVGDLRFAGASWSQPQLLAPFLAALELATGAPRWIRAMPAVEADVLAISEAGPLLVAGSWKERLEADRDAVLSGPPRDISSWLAELDPRTGAVRWATTLGAAAFSQAQGVASLSDGRTVVVGLFGGHFEIGGRGFESRGPKDVFVAMVDPRGIVTAATAIGGPGSDQVKDIAVLADGKLALWGHHQGLQLGDTSIPGQGFTDGFYAELRLAELFAQSGSR